MHPGQRPDELQCAWLPQNFILTAPLMGRRLFMAQHSEPFLLVRLDASENELALGLASSTTLGKATDAQAKGTRDEIGFATVAHGQNTVRRMLNEIRATRASSVKLDVSRSLLHETRFLVPIRKRDRETAFLERITVGRARNNDIVLRHKTVSKFHAWWEYDKDGGLWLRDAESKNFSFANGAVVRNEPVRIEMGAVVRFGSVEATICSAETLWELISGEPE